MTNACYCLIYSTHNVCGIVHILWEALFRESCMHKQCDGHYLEKASLAILKHIISC